MRPYLSYRASANQIARRCFQIVPKASPPLHQTGGTSATIHQTKQLTRAGAGRLIVPTASLNFDMSGDRRTCTRRRRLWAYERPYQQNTYAGEANRRSEGRGDCDHSQGGRWNRGSRPDVAQEGAERPIKLERNPVKAEAGTAETGRM
jgi:hypothetical protein